MIKKIFNNRQSQNNEDGPRRNLSPGMKNLLLVLGLIWVAFHLYTGFFGQIYSYHQRGIFLIFSLVFAFLLYPANRYSANKDKISPVDILLIFSTVLIGLYIIVESPEYGWRAGLASNLDIVAWTALIVIILEAVRRVIGKALVIIALLFLFYTFTGPYWPGLLQHRGADISRVSSYLIMSTEGIFGIAIAVGATYLVMFFLFGYLMQNLGGGKFLIDLSYALLGRFRGGPAKVAIIASALFGSISGVPAVNVATTGMFTIPLMKRIGYKGHYAGAVEASASSGGQIMPPVMGIAAFLIAEILGVSYRSVIIAAALPAILFFLALILMTHLQSYRLGITGIHVEKLPKIKNVIKEGWFYIIPLLVLIYLLIYRQFSPLRAASWAVLAMFLIALINKQNRKKVIEWLKFLGSASLEFVPLGVAVACIGIIIGTFSLTGLSIKMSTLLIDISGGNLLVLLIFTMVTSLILGMGLPTVVAYMMLSILVAPALITMGVMPMAAHLFILYYGALSAISPPVCFASLVAAQIAGAPMLKTAFTSVKLSLCAFILPFMFVYSPALLLQGSVFTIIVAAITSLVGVSALAAAIEGYLIRSLHWAYRFVLFAASLVLIKGGWETDIIGFLAFGAVIILQLASQRLSMNKDMLDERMHESSKSGNYRGNIKK